MSTSFWCSRCKIRHPGECPPPQPAAVPLGNGGLITAHDWEAGKIIDLYTPYTCKKCGASKRISIVKTFIQSVGSGDLPTGPCP